jgi:hypothetical protein
LASFQDSENHLMDRDGLGVLDIEDTATDGVMRSDSPSVYVPRRFRIGGVGEIRTGAAIVGTPQGDGMVAINVEATAYVEPSPAVWITWLCQAVRRHARTGEEQLLMEAEAQTRLVPETALIEVGRWVNDCMVAADPGARDEINRWIEAGAADYHVDGYLPADEAAVA